MNEVDFRNWLSGKGLNKKYQSDIVSRIRKIEREIDHCDIDEQYHSDQCEYLMSLFLNMGQNPQMQQYPNANFPIGKYHMSTFRLAINYYRQFCQES